MTRPVDKPATQPEPEVAAPIVRRKGGAQAAPAIDRRWTRYIWILFVVAWGVWISRYVWPFFVPLEPARTLIDFSAGHPLHYEMVVTHGVAGSLAVLAACVQIWPWIRRVHPLIHRTSGYVYIAAALTCSTALVFLLVYKGTQAKTIMYLWAVTWFATTVVGLHLARRRNLVKHRKWMAYSIALGMGVVGTGVSVEIALKVFPTQVNILFLKDVIAWAPWVVTLAIAFWWLRRTRGSPVR